MLHSDTLSGLDSGTSGKGLAAAAIAAKSVTSKPIARTTTTPLTDHSADLGELSLEGVVELRHLVTDVATVLPESNCSSEGSLVTLGDNESRVSDKGPEMGLSRVK